MLDSRIIDISERESLPLWTVIFLTFIYEDQLEFIEKIYNENFLEYSSHVTILEKRGLVKKHGFDVKDFTLRKAGEDLLKKYLGKKAKKTPSDVKLWIDNWRQLFPAGVNSAGYRYRGEKMEVLKKMIKFVNSYDYTKEEIFKATENYVKRFALRGYAYMQQAHYFIEKQGTGSTLAAECEGLREKPQNKENEQRGYGRTIR